MTDKDKKVYSQIFNECYSLFRKYCGIRQEDESAWNNLVSKATEITEKYKCELSSRMTQGILFELEDVSKKHN